MKASVWLLKMALLSRSATTRMDTAPKREGKKIGASTHGHTHVSSVFSLSRASVGIHRLQAISYKLKMLDKMRHVFAAFMR